MLHYLRGLLLGTALCLVILLVGDHVHDLTQVSTELKEVVIINVHCDGIQIACGHHLLNLRAVTIDHRLHIETACLADRREGIGVLEIVTQSLQLRNHLLDLTEDATDIFHLRVV